MFLVLTVLGSTDIKAPVGFAGLAIGLVLTLIHLVGIPITNTSVNPARSIGPAIFVGGWAVEQLWLFWLAPIAGAILGGALYKWLVAESPQAEAAWGGSGAEIVVIQRGLPEAGLRASFAAALSAERRADQAQAL